MNVCIVYPLACVIVPPVATGSPGYCIITIPEPPAPEGEALLPPPPLPVLVAPAVAFVEP